MAVNPLDLQVSFSQINQVGKQQSALKESDDIKQEQASQILNKISAKETQDVPETKDIKEGAGKVKDKEKEEKNRSKKKNPDDKNENGNEEKKDEKDKDIKDPNLGQKIDILG